MRISRVLALSAACEFLSIYAYAHPIKLLNLTNIPVVIDEPGEYSLAKNWDLGSEVPGGTAAIEVTANNVSIDFRGFTIEYDYNGFGVRISGTNVTLRNGGIRTTAEGQVVWSKGSRTLLENMELQDFESGVRLEGDSSIVRNSTVNGGLFLGAVSTVEASEIDCLSGCVTAGGDGVEVLRNRIFAGHVLSDECAICVRNDAVFVGNLMAVAGAGGTGILVEGDDNLISENVIRERGPLRSAIVISGTSNIVDHNIAQPGNAKCQEGIVFVHDGNFYGDNRMAAETPFVLNGTAQTDWGGNVGF